ncbi:MAG: pilus assembly protein PilP [Gammaproteobacteria bacterium]|nr:pilus assembly protein PilP [Gammaproteobacteria bacterium]MBK8132821.1 pilus assembly protein PilP [Gammaproteobacteria bacterium]MBK9428608.1 pilus assembly protein PilP [Gammaproteobacteria bacterium]
MSAQHVRLGLLLLTALLVGCGGDREFRDLQDFMAKTRAKPGGKIDPIPTFPPYEIFKYGAMALRSPFDAPATVAAESASGTPAVAPSQARAREVLENYDFASLSMVGSLYRDGARWSLIDDGAGQIHRVTLGSYMGKNHGRIVSVNEDRTDVTETIPDGEGGWVERPRTLSLKEIH